MLGNRSYR